MLQSQVKLARTVDFKSVSCLFLNRLYKFNEYKFHRVRYVFMKRKHCNLKTCLWYLKNIIDRRSISSDIKNVESETDKFSAVEKLSHSGYLRYRDFEHIVVDARKYENFDLKSCLFLQCLRKLPDIDPQLRIKLAKGLLQEMRDKNVVITQHHYEELLGCFVESKLSESLESFVELMKNDGVELSQNIAELLLKCLSESGKYKEAAEFASSLEKSGNFQSEAFYSTLVYNNAKSGNFSEINNLLRKVENEQITLGSEIYKSLLRVAVVRGDKTYFQELLNELKMKNIKIVDSHVVEILETISLTKTFHLVPILMEFYGMDTFPDVLMGNLLIKIVHSQNVSSAFEFLEVLLQQNWSPASYKYFIEELVKINHPFEDLMKKCVTLRQYQQCQYSIEHVLYLYLKEKNIDRSLDVLRTMKDNKCTMQTHYFWPLMIQLHENFSQEGLFQCLDVMKKLEVPICPDTLKYIFYPRLVMNVSVFKRLISLLPNSMELFRDIYIAFALENGRFQNCLQLLKDFPLDETQEYSLIEKSCFKALVDYPPCFESVSLVKMFDGFDVFEVIETLLNKAEVDRAHRLIQLCQSLRLTIKEKGKVTAVLSRRDVPLSMKSDINLWLKKSNMDTTLDRRGKPKTKLSVTDGLKLVEKRKVALGELKAKNMNSTAEEFRLLRDYMRNGYIDKAIETRNRLIQSTGNKISLTPGMKALFFRMAVFERNTDEALKYYDDIHDNHPSFAFDCHKTLSLCALLAEKKMLHDLKRVLKHLPVWKEDKIVIERKVALLLKATSKCCDFKLTNEIFNTLMDKNYIILNNNTLQAFTQTYIEANDIEGAVKEYKRIHDVYRLCPNSIYIVNKIIDSNKLELLDEVIRCRKKIDDSFLVLAQILEVFASKEDVVAVINYSKKFNTPLNDANLWWKYFKYSEKHSLTCLKTFFFAASTVHGYSEFFFDIVLDRLRNTNDYESAKTFVTELEEKNINVRTQKKAELKLFISRYEAITERINK